MGLLWSLGDCENRTVSSFVVTDYRQTSGLDRGRSVLLTRETIPAFTFWRSLLQTTGPVGSLRSFVYG